MSRIIVEYNPTISVESQKLIRDNITPSMVSNDETSCQYDISMVADLILDFDHTKDVHYINDLINEGVHYIEF